MRPRKVYEEVSAPAAVGMYRVNIVTGIRRGVERQPENRSCGIAVGLDPAIAAYFAYGPHSI